MKIKHLTYSDGTLICTLEDGTVQIETNPDKVNHLVQVGLKFFTEHPGEVLDFDYDKGYTEPLVKYINEVQPEALDGHLMMDTKVLSRYFTYSKKNGFLDGFDRFLDKISQHPDPDSMRDLLEFLDKNNLPLTQDGNILGFKALAPLRDTYCDRHTMLIEQDVGDCVQMPREMVTFDKSLHCSYGLHVADLEYAKGFDFYTEVFLVGVRTEDVVSVPSDTNSKVRVQKYTILYKLTDEDIQSLEGGVIPSSISKFILSNLEDFKVQNVISLLSKEVQGPEDITVQNVIYDTEDTKGTEKTKEVQSLKVVKDQNDGFSETLKKVLEYVKDPYLDHFKARYILEFYKGHKGSITWKSLGVNDTLRKRIARLAKD